MSLPLQCLLRLPTCLRSQALVQGLPSRSLTQRLDTGTIMRRAFSDTRTTLRQTRPAKSTPSKQPAPPVRTIAPPPAQHPKPKTYTDMLFASGDEVLVYRAPNHLSFMISSYIAGAILLVGAYNSATMTLQPLPGQENQKRTWRGYLATVPVTVTALFFAVAGTAVFLAPAKMIKTISAIAPKQSGVGLPILRYETRSPLPFMKTKTILVLPSEAHLDRVVSAVEIDFTSVPLAQAGAFTASRQRDAAPTTAALQRGFFSRAWTTLQRDVRRMMLRDGFAYVRFEEQGNWKLDLSECELLDNGRVLERLTTPDTQKGVGLIALFKRKYLI